MQEKSLHVVVGLGVTGMSCVRYLQKQGLAVAVVDTRENPPMLAELQQSYPLVPVFLGKLDSNLLAKANTIILSPGVSLQTPEIAAQVQLGKKVIGDIELFAHAVHSPVIAITGTNAKSTVTTLVGLMAKTAGFNVQVGGNLGVPALDLLMANKAANLYVLELSSFQLETLYSLRPAVASILNITPDHLDRYPSYEAYAQAKLRIYKNCEVAVYNLDDPLTYCRDTEVEQHYTFSLNAPNKDGFGLLHQGNDIFLAYEQSPLLSVKALPVSGKHYQANALAALAIGYGFGLPMDAMLKVLREFKGLPHRCQFIREINGVKWFNDSKGTNVGATLAAIEGLGADISGKLVLIAGGLGKNADFNLLVPAIAKYARSVILIGAAANEIGHAIGNKTQVVFADSMADAIAKAKQAAVPKDCVLLSPACASYDMFKNFEHRGEVFSELVTAL